MKIAAFILAALIFAMSIIPCADKSDAICKVKTEIREASHSHQHTSGICSPFCSCSCCSSIAITVFPLISSKVTGTVNKQINSFLPSETIDITLPVWQPPQLI